MMDARGISRRDFVAGASLMAAGTALGVNPLKAAEPKKGGRFRAALTGASTSDSFDPALYNSVSTNIYGATFGNCLLEIDSKNKLVSELAETWEPSKDLAQWRFKLRKGVEFHNGKTLTAQDVVFSLNRHRGEGNKSAMSGVMKAVSDITADGDAVVIKLTSGNADFPWNLADLHTVIIPDGTTDFSKGIGTGPYVIKEFDPGVRVVASRNPNYWKQGAAHFDEIETLGIADPTARVNALLTGAVDAIDRINLQAVDRLKGNSKFSVLNVTGYRHCTMSMRVDTPPFDNVDVRLAIKHAINRKDIMDRVLKGYGTLANDHPISPVQQFYAALPQREYDPDKVKFHLKKAGAGKLSVTLQVAEAAFNGAVDAAVLFKEQAAATGIDLNIQRMPDDGYFQKVWLVSPFCVSYWSGRPTADAIFSLGYSSKAAWNECKWSNKRFDDLLVAARVELDEKKRQDMYTEMQTLVRDDDGNIIPFFMNYVFARKSNVQSNGEAGNFDMDGYRMLERWWFA
ncbi:MAG: ABC transporter substrate-binding protein [Pseudomonadota bacterium]